MLRLPILTCLLALACALSGAPQAAAQGFDILIRNGRVLDGTGNPDIRADIGIRGDKIVAIGRLDGAPAARNIDAEGFYVAPGFIDLHSHADRLLADDDVDGRRAHNLISQGITTVVGGADGRNIRWPLSAERAAYERLGIGQNVVLMVGHSTVRRQVMGDDYEREATPEEVARMQALVREAMEEGAWGLGAGLEYRPARFSSPAEVIELARVVADYDGFYVSHQRNEAPFPMWYLPGITREPPMDAHGALRETIDIARETGIRVVASHIKSRTSANWGRSVSDITLIENARAKGLQVYADQYPYTYGGGGGRILVPGWAFAPPGFGREGGLDDPRLRQDVMRDHRENLGRNAADPETRRRLEADIAYLISYWSGPENQIVVSHPDPEVVGTTLTELARQRGQTPVEIVLHYALNPYEDEPGGGFLVRMHSMNEFDIENYMRQDWMAIASDAWITDPASPPGAGSHPRMYGAFVRKLAEYVKDRGVVSLPFAVRSATGLPAQIIGLRDRGFLREGYQADVVIFDYGTLRDHATMLEPNRYSEGIRYVLVNGELAVDEGRLTGALTGAVIGRPAALQP